MSHDLYVLTLGFLLGLTISAGVFWKLMVLAIRRVFDQIVERRKFTHDGVLYVVYPPTPQTGSKPSTGGLK